MVSKLHIREYSKGSQNNLLTFKAFDHKGLLIVHRFLICLHKFATTLLYNCEEHMLTHIHIWIINGPWLHHLTKINRTRNMPSETTAAGFVTPTQLSTWLLSPSNVFHTINYHPSGEHLEFYVHPISNWTQSERGIYHAVHYSKRHFCLSIQPHVIFMSRNSTLFCWVYRTWACSKNSPHRVKGHLLWYHVDMYFKVIFTQTITEHREVDSRRKKACVQLQLHGRWLLCN